MKILIVASEVPYPPHDSNRACYYNLLQRWRGRHAVTVVAMSAGAAGADAAEVRKLVDELVVVPFEVKKTARRRLANVFSPLPFGVALYRNPGFCRALADLLTRKRFDIIIGGNINMAQYTAGLAGPPKVINPQDAWSLYYRRLVAAARNPAASAYARLQYLKVRRYESRTYRRYDACVVVAQRDAAVIRDLCPGLPIHFAYSGVDVPPLAPVDKVPTSIAFSGVMDYPPNADAALYFVKEIWPLVKRAAPEAAFHVVGRSPTKKVRELAAAPGVVVTGRVGDVVAYLRRMEVYVCPMRLGSGMKMKIVEALAAALPVVSTSIGAEGMDKLTPGENLIVADEPAAFARAINDLLNDTPNRERLGDAGRAKVEQYYTWDANARQWEDIIAAVVKRPITL